MNLVCSVWQPTDLLLHALQEQYVFVEDVALQQTSTGYNVLVQQLELVSLTRTALTRGKSAQMPT